MSLQKRPEKGNWGRRKDEKIRRNVFYYGEGITRVPGPVRGALAKVENGGGNS